MVSANRMAPLNHKLTKDDGDAKEITQGRLRYARVASIVGLYIIVTAMYKTE